MNLIKQHLGTITILLLLSVIVLLIIWRLISKKRRGTCISCACCSQKSTCHINKLN